MTAPDYLAQPLGQFLDQVAARRAAPGGGSVAAAAVAMAAGLAGKAASFSDGQLPDADAVAARADDLRARAAPLVRADADAYGEVLSAS